MSDVDLRWRPSRRAFLCTAGAAAVMVQIGGWWPGFDSTVRAAETGADLGLRPARLRRAATAGPPNGRAHGNVLVHRATIDGAAFTVWYGDGGRAMAIGARDGEVEAHYVDPTRRTVTDTVDIKPLAQLAHEIRTHFGDREWRAMRRAARLAAA